MRIIAALALLAVAACSDSNADESRLVIETRSGAHEFSVELADDEEELRTGLMYRNSLGPDAGMLFDFGPAPRPVSMWMKNTLIPLDMAFIAESGRIARIVAMTTPQSLTSIPSGEDVVAVLEVRGGRFAELGVKEGDIVRHPWFER